MSDIKNKVDHATGEVKEKVGEATGNESLEREGVGQQLKSDMKDAGESVKDAGKKVVDEAKDAVGR